MCFVPWFGWCLSSLKEFWVRILGWGGCCMEGKDVGILTFENVLGIGDINLDFDADLRRSCLRCSPINPSTNPL